MRTRKSEKSQWVSGDNFQFHTPKTPRLKESRRKTHHGGTSSWIHMKQHKSGQKSCIRHVSGATRTHGHNKSIRFSLLEEEKNGRLARSIKTERTMRSFLKAGTSVQESKYLTVNIETLSPKEPHLNLKKRGVSDVDVDISAKKVKKQVKKKPITSTQKSSPPMHAKNHDSTKKRARSRETSSSTPRKTRSKVLKETDKSMARRSSTTRKESPRSPSKSHKNPSPKVNTPNKDKFSKTASPKSIKSPKPVRSPPRMKSPETRKKIPSPKKIKISEILKSPSPMKISKTGKRSPLPKEMDRSKILKSPSPKKIKSPKTMKRSTSPKKNKSPNILKSQSPKVNRSPKVTNSPRYTKSLLSSKKKKEIQRPEMIDSPSTKRKSRTSITEKSSKKLKTPSSEKKLKSPRNLKKTEEQTSPGPGPSKMDEMGSPSPRMKNNMTKMKEFHNISFEEEHLAVEMMKKNLPVIWKTEVFQEDIKSTDVAYLNGTDETEAGHSYTSLKSNAESSIFEDKLEDLKKGADLFEEQVENDTLLGQENSSSWSCNIL